jgi:succinate-semialdehyde dehydrogenase/glutarate-semialdehyde dehydrogenase
VSPYERAQILHRAVKIIEERRSTFVNTIVAEAGFTLVDAHSEITRALDTLTLSAEEAKRVLGQTVPLDGNPGQQDRLGFTIRLPVGIVCAITPFNSPLNAVLHKVGPALAAGNALILKPSGHTPITASLLCDALLDAGLPPGLISLINGEAEVGQHLLNHPDIDFYAFTGSTRVGRLIQAAAGLRRTQLELGSIACTIVCADADLDAAIPKIARASFRKAGQVCTSIQRLYVEASIAEEVTVRLVKAAAAMPCGDPRKTETMVGPMISVREAERALSWIKEASDQHARIEHGGDREGSVLQLTVLGNVRSGMAVMDREIFAPVVSVLPVADVNEAIRGINAMPFGLAAGIFTRDLNRAFMAARTIKVGAVHVNETSSSRIDSMPYGGVKDSGFGREGPAYAVREMTDERVVTISL